MAKHDPKHAETKTETKVEDVKEAAKTETTAAAPAATTAAAAPAAEAAKGEKAPPFTKGPRNIPADAKITMGKDKEGKEYGPEHNPKRPGSATYERFKSYKTGATIEDVLKAGVTSADIDYDIKKGFISVSGGTAKAEKVAVTETKAEEKAHEAETKAA